MSTQCTDGTSIHIYITIDDSRYIVNTQEQSKFQTECLKKKKHIKKSHRVTGRCSGTGGEIVNRSVKRAYSISIRGKHSTRVRKVG